MNIRQIHDEFCRDGSEEGVILAGCRLYVNLQKAIKSERDRCAKIIRDSAITDDEVFRVINEIVEGQTEMNTCNCKDSHNINGVCTRCGWPVR